MTNNISPHGKVICPNGCSCHNFAMFLGRASAVKCHFELKLKLICPKGCSCQIFYLSKVPQIDVLPCILFNGSLPRHNYLCNLALLSPIELYLTGN